MLTRLRKIRHRLCRYRPCAALEVTLRDMVRPLANTAAGLAGGVSAGAAFYPAALDRRPFLGTSRDAAWRPSGMRDLHWMSSHAPRPNPEAAEEESLRIAFLLEDAPRAGGVISITLLVEDLRRSGHQVLAAVRAPRRADPELTARLDAVTCAADRHLVRNVTGWRPHVVVATFWPTAYLAARCYREADAAFWPVYYAQDYEPDFYPDDAPWFRQAVRATYSAMPWAFCKTPWLAERLEAEGARVSLVPPALDLTLFSPAETIAEEPPTVLAMVRPDSARRGWPVLREALKRVHDRLGSRVRFAVYGCDEPTWKSLAAPFPAEVLGVLDTAGVAAACRRASIFVEASDFHGFGRTVAEAMACGVPCVITDSGGVGLFAKHNVNALISPPGDAESLASHVIRLLEDKTLRQRLSQSCRSSVMWMDRMASARATADLFRDLLAGRHPAKSYGYPSENARG